MANPNIVAVATIEGGSLGWNLTDSLANLVTVSADYILKLNRIVATNVDGGSAMDLDVAVTLDGTNATTMTGVTVTGGDTTMYLASTISIPADASLVVLDTPIYLRAADILKAKGSTTAKIDLFISFEVLID
jgi:phosphoribosylformylglycinamidine (FGAM) synthase-like enzyme